MTSRFRMIDCKTIERPAAVDPGPAPMLQWICIDQLVVDDSYQRDLKGANWTAIKRIAARFKWSRFSPVFVAPTEGGYFAVIDGQHRTHAAAICGFAEVPCQVVQMTREEQAASFAAVNGIVTQVTAWQVFKAALVAGEEWAVRCAAVCSDAGCTLMTGNQSADQKKAGEVYALKLIRQHVDAGRGAMVTVVLGALRNAEFGAEAAAYANEILRPLLAAVSDRPWLVAGNVELSGFLDSFDLYAAIDRAADLAREKRRQGDLGYSKFDLSAVLIGEGLDKAFPQRMALPKKEEAA